MANLSFFAAVLLMALFVQDGESVRCYTCSSDLNPICNDPFPIYARDEHTIVPLVNCDANVEIYPYMTPTFKSVCKKQKKSINGEEITVRGCAWKPTADQTSKCPSSSGEGTHVFTISCETCEYDGCNGSLAAPAGEPTTTETAAPTTTSEKST